MAKILVNPNRIFSSPKLPFLMTDFFQLHTKKAPPGHQKAQLIINLPTFRQPGYLLEDPWLSVPWSPMVWLYLKIFTYFFLY